MVLAVTVIRQQNEFIDVLLAAQDKATTAATTTTTTTTSITSTTSATSCWVHKASDMRGKGDNVFLSIVSDNLR